jgi:hypothetical protein
MGKESEKRETENNLKSNKMQERESLRPRRHGYTNREKHRERERRDRGVQRETQREGKRKCR